MLNLNNQYLYVKGTCNVNVSDIATGEVVFASSKVMNNALTTSVDMGEIRAGLGNPIAIQLPSNAAVNLELSTADFNLQARAMQVGGMLAYNGIRPMCAAVTASGTTISLPEGATPVANYGFDKVYAYVTYAGAENVGTAYGQLRTRHLSCQHSAGCVHDRRWQRWQSWQSVRLAVHLHPAYAVRC